VVDAVFHQTVELLVSAALVAEYRLVLARPKQTARHRLSSSELEAYISSFVAGAATEEPHPAPQICPDPTDQMLWDLLAERPDAILATGEGRLQRSDHFPGRVLSPREFVKRYLDA
jgi:predicted nucleic acid-binding protein